MLLLLRYEIHLGLSFTAIGALVHKVGNTAIYIVHSSIGIWYASYSRTYPTPNGYTRTPKWHEQLILELSN